MGRVESTSKAKRVREKGKKNPTDSNLPKVKGKGGRPPGSTKISKGTSKVTVKCAVCKLERRNDKIKEHQIKAVLFNENGEAADESHPKYSSLRDTEKMHTDFFRINKFNRTCLPHNQVVVNRTPSDIKSFFTKKVDDKNDEEIGPPEVTLEEDAETKEEGGNTDLNSDEETSIFLETPAEFRDLVEDHRTATRI